jgi:hypothetical protein
MPPGDLLLGLTALVLLVFPGWRLARERGLPLPALAGFTSGAVGLMLLLQLLDTCGLGLSAGTIFPAWLLVCLVAFRTHRRSTPASGPVAGPGPIDWMLLLPVVPAIGVVAYRAIAQPLFGVDTVFRWNFLAEQMLARGTLAFYPPVSAADYTIYAWPDGIAPVVSSLYFWAYALAGSARPGLTAPVVIFQFFLILAAVHTLARQLASPRAAAFACALVACTPIIPWSTAMGQESGLMAIALLAMLLYLPTDRATARPAAALMAGLAAALAGLAREYGLAFILLGFGLGLVRRLSPQTMGIFLLGALLGTLPWYGRNWLHTGNPVFNLDVAGCFPVNTAHLRLMQIYQASFGWDKLPPEARRIFMTNCLIALSGGIAGACLCFRQVRALLAAFLFVAGLWAVSLGYTAAGFTYSLRVLTPALVIASILGGVALARWGSARRSAIGLTFVLLVFAGEAALRTLVLPANLYKVPPADWLAVGGAVHEYHQRPVYRQLAAQVAGQRMVVLGPAALLTHHGAQVVPPWSPEVAYLWDPTMTTAVAARRLLAGGVHFVLLNTGAVNEAYLGQMPFFRNLPNAGLRPVWGDSDMTLYQVIDPPRPVGPVPPAARDQP